MDRAYTVYSLQNDEAIVSDKIIFNWSLYIHIKDVFWLIPKLTTSMWLLSLCIKRYNDNNYTHH